MFQVTVVNLTPDARHAKMRAGPLPLGELTTSQLTELLESFAQIDPVENNDADPEIRLEARRRRFLIRTAQKKLFLHNPRDLTEPAYVLTPREIIEELDGTADARRTQPPIPADFKTGETPAFGGTAFPTTETAPPISEPGPRPYGLILLVLALGGYVAYSEFTSRPANDPAPPTLLPAAEAANEDANLTGAYMTGTEPGHHGIVILGAGRIELFQVNARGGPGTVYATYQLGRRNGDLVLVTDQPGGLITVTGRDSVGFCGETHKRVRGR